MRVLGATREWCTQVRVGTLSTVYFSDNQCEVSTIIVSLYTDGSSGTVADDSALADGSSRSGNSVTIALLRMVVLVTRSATFSSSAALSPTLFPVNSSSASSPHTATTGETALF